MVYPKIIINWIDISSHDGAWMDLEEALKFKPIAIETCGWMIKETEDYVVVVSSVSFDEDDNVIGSVNAIPRGCIVSIKRLEVSQG